MNINIAKYILIGITLLSVLFGFFITRLDFDYDFESFFPKDDPELDFYINFRDKFSNDYEFFLIGMVNSEGVFEEDFLQEVKALTDSLLQLEDVLSVQSPSNVSFIVMGPLGPIKVPYLHIDKPELYATDSARIFKSEFLMGTLFSKSANAVAILAETEPNLSKERSDVLAQELNLLLPKFHFDDIHVAGRVFGQLYYIEKMKQELAIFISISLVFLIIILWFIFRTTWGVWVPLVIVLLTAVWLLGIMSATGKAIDVMTALLPTILFVVGVSDVVHIVSKYLEELRKGHGKKKAIAVTFKEIGTATFLTSFTTAVGFLTLISGSIKPINDFGIYTAVGVFVAFILAFTLLPAILYINPRPNTAKKRIEQLFWYGFLSKWYAYTLRNYKGIIIFSGFVIAVFLWGISFVKVDNYLLEDLADGDPHKKDFVFFEQNFSGVRPFELSVQLKDSTANLLEFENIQSLAMVEDYLKNTYEVGFISSPVSFVKMANQALSGGNPEAYKIPTSEEEYRKIQPILNRLKKQPMFEGFADLSNNQVRFSGKMEDIGGRENRERKSDFDKYMIDNFDTEKWQWNITGMAWLIDLNNTSLSRDMMMGLLIAFGVIACIMGLLFRNLTIIILSLIPNILPLIIVGGIMGFSGIDLKISTSIIFTIAFGIAVDDTIHFMTKFKLELNKGKSILYALKRSCLSTGKAIIVTSIILCGGFFTLFFSTFASTYYIGLLVSITLFAAIVSDLLLLPALIIAFYKPKKTTKLKELKQTTGKTI